MEPVFASVPLKSTYILDFVVARSPSFCSSSVGFWAKGRIIFRSLPTSSGLSSSSSFMGMLLILFLISSIPAKINENRRAVPKMLIRVELVTPLPINTSLSNIVLAKEA